MIDLKSHIAAVPDFPRAGILFRGIMPLLKSHFEPAVGALDAAFPDTKSAPSSRSST
jgi:hypothetical protein